MLPQVPTSAQWDQVSHGLIWFWLFVVAIVVFATCLLMAHAFIPSLVSTRQLPARAASARPVFYGLAILALVAAVIFFANIVIHLRVLYDLYGKVWI